jgi:hypothetical protein
MAFTLILASPFKFSQSPATVFQTFALAPTHQPSADLLFVLPSKLDLMEWKAGPSSLLIDSGSHRLAENRSSAARVSFEVCLREGSK